MIKVQNLENEALVEKLGILRQENVRVEHKVSQNEIDLREQVCKLQIKLDEYELAEEEIIRALDELARQDVEWHGVY